MNSEFLRTFVNEYLLGAIGKFPDHILKDRALAWFDKGVLTEEDLKVFAAAIRAKNVEVVSDEIDL